MFQTDRFNWMSDIQFRRYQDSIDIKNTLRSKYDRMVKISGIGGHGAEKKSPLTLQSPAMRAHKTNYNPMSSPIQRCLQVSQEPIFQYNSQAGPFGALSRLPAHKKIRIHLETVPQSQILNSGSTVRSFNNSEDIPL